MSWSARPDERVRARAQQPRGLRVHVRDPQLRVHDVHAVGGGVQNLRTLLERCRVLPAHGGRERVQAHRREDDDRHHHDRERDAESVGNAEREREVHP